MAQGPNPNRATTQSIHDGNPGGMEIGNPTSLTTFMGLTPFDQLISTDNDTLLTSGTKSWIRVTNPSTGGTASDFSVGMENGTVDGQLCFIQVMKDYVLELNDSVSGSANIILENDNSEKGFSGYASGNSQRSSAMLSWQESDSTWYEITLTQTTVV